MNARRKKSDRKEREKKLDQAIEMTFPASDPIAVGRPTSTEAQQGRSVSAKASGGKRAVGMRFTIGLKSKGRVHHLVVDGEDALIAALKVKCQTRSSCTSARKTAGVMRGIHLSRGPRQPVTE